MRISKTNIFIIPAIVSTACMSRMASQALMMALIEGHEGAMNLISRLRIKSEFVDEF